MQGLRFRKVETFLGESQHELGPHRQVGDRLHATGRQPVGAKVQGDAMPAFNLKKCSRAGLILYK